MKNTHTTAGAIMIALVFSSIIVTPTAVWAQCGCMLAVAPQRMTRLVSDATQVAIVRRGDQTIVAMQNAYEGPPEAFAMVVPVPEVLAQGDVKTLPVEGFKVFDSLDQITAPVLVEYEEMDPCRNMWDGGTMIESASMSAGASPPQVTVEARFAVGEYDIEILGANDSSALETYLRQHKVALPDGADKYLQPYVQDGMYFFVATVDPARLRLKDGRAILSPLRFQYTAKEFGLPIRLGMINSAGQHDLVIYAIAEQRVEVANLPNVFIPTNLEVAPEVSTGFNEFYEALFDETVRKNPGAVVTEAVRDLPCHPLRLDPRMSTQGATFDGAGNAVSCQMPNELAQLGARDLAPSKPWVLTRLHLRYRADGIGEDLLFRGAPAVEGGQGVIAPGDVYPPGVVASGRNAFSSRYFIRHRYQGAVWCKEPEFGRYKIKRDTSWRGALSPNTRGTPLRSVFALDYDLEGALVQRVPELDIDGEPPSAMRGSQESKIWAYLRSVRNALVAFAVLPVIGGSLLFLLLSPFLLIRYVWRWGRG